MAEKLYSGWLPEVYSADNVHVQSIDCERTIMSAQANLISIYPSISHKYWNGVPGKQIQLVPIHTIPLFQDNVCI